MFDSQNLHVVCTESLGKSLAVTFKVQLRACSLLFSDACHSLFTLQIPFLTVFTPAECGCF